MALNMFCVHLPSTKVLGYSRSYLQHSLHRLYMPTTFIVTKDCVVHCPDFSVVPTALNMFCVPFPSTKVLGYSLSYLQHSLYCPKYCPKQFTISEKYNDYGVKNAQLTNSITRMLELRRDALWSILWTAVTPWRDRRFLKRHRDAALRNSATSLSSHICFIGVNRRQNNPVKNITWRVYWLMMCL